jgi:hypothetical protein
MASGLGDDLGSGGFRCPTAAQPAHNRSEQDVIGLRHAKRKKKRT